MSTLLGKRLYAAMQTEDRCEWPEDWKDVSPYWKIVYQRIAIATCADLQARIDRYEQAISMAEDCVEYGDWPELQAAVAVARGEQ